MLDAKECWQLFQGDDHFMSLDLPRILYHIQDKYRDYTDRLPRRKRYCSQLYKRS